MQSFLKKNPLTQIVLIFLVVEGFLFSWMWAIRQFAITDLQMVDASLYMGIPREENPWLEPWQRWDTTHYQAIARDGFESFETAYFTPPLYPALMDWTAPIFGGNTMASGLFISGLSFLGSLLVIYRLSLDEFGSGELSLRTAFYTAIYPGAFFLAAAYNESLFLLTVLLCFLFMRRGQWLPAGFAALLAFLTRIPGIFLVIPLAYAGWKAWRRGDRKGWVSLIVMGLGTAVWYTYQWFVLGAAPTAILEAQEKRGGYMTLPGLNLLEAGRRILEGWLAPINAIELFFTLVFIILTILVWKKLPRVYGLYAVSLMLFFLMRMGYPHPLVGMMRYTMEIFPVFFLFAEWGGRQGSNRTIVYPFLAGLLFFSAQFASWGWVG
ncbi:hypothetical protein ACFLXB_02330 [Chloroflexota bacterium]